MFLLNLIFLTLAQLHQWMCLYESCTTVYISVFYIYSLCNTEDVIFQGAVRPLRGGQCHGVGQQRGKVLAALSGGGSLDRCTLLLEQRLVFLSERDCFLLANGLDLQLLLQVYVGGFTA